MRRLRHRLSPSLIIATAALAAATGGGTAIAAGEFITRSDQIAPSVIDGNHIKPHSVGRTHVQHPALRLHVTSDAKLSHDTGDGTVKQIGIGMYVVTFNRDAVQGGVGAPKGRWLDQCAVLATPRSGAVFGPNAENGRSLSVQPAGDASSVVIYAFKPDYKLGQSVLHNTPFEIAAVC